MYLNLYSQDWNPRNKENNILQFLNFFSSILSTIRPKDNHFSFLLH